VINKIITTTRNLFSRTGGLIRSPRSCLLYVGLSCLVSGLNVGLNAVHEVSTVRVMV